MVFLQWKLIGLLSEKGTISSLLIMSDRVWIDQGLYVNCPPLCLISGYVAILEKILFDCKDRQI